MSLDVITSLRTGAATDDGRRASVTALLPPHVAARVPTPDNAVLADELHDATASHPLAVHVPLWEAHVRRLVDASRAVCAIYPDEWRTAPSVHDILSSDAVAQLWEVTQAGPPHRCSLRLAASGALRAVIAPLGAKPATTPVVRLDTCETRLEGPLTKLKTSSREAYDSARARVGGTLGAGDVFDALLWYRDGDEQVVTESSIANLIVESPQGDLYTPVFEHLLPGLLVKELCRLGLVAERRITVADLVAWKNSHTFYLSNAVRGMFKVQLDL
ncbi:hypothetical protein MCUN1_002343 [Malassezia cuniculi]|uniref:Uncharacterized protein n=1 Tax=Malassezia cuniculi TaxID=948313 RepID=A0AAF0J6E9_9BASI|nr:hypothetical protein MCUN1_002343 [Malassezia cuniculi]